jgi:hypothetical protein
MSAVCPTEPCGTSLAAGLAAVAAAGSGMAPLGITQNFSDLLIRNRANGATCAAQVFIAAAPVGLRAKFSSDNSALLAVA